MHWHVSEKDLYLSQYTYHDSKREHVRRLVELALEMRLWTAPIVITSQHPFNAPAFGDVGCVFEVSDLCLFGYGLLTDVAAVDRNVVRLDV